MITRKNFFGDEVKTELTELLRYNFVRYDEHMEIEAGNANELIGDITEAITQHEYESARMDCIRLLSRLDGLVKMQIEKETWETAMKLTEEDKKDAKSRG